jgi:repressor LexA
MILNQQLFIERLTELMENFDDNTYTLADYLHFAPSTIHRYLTGENKPKTITIECLAKKYGISPAWLMGADVEKYLDAQDEEKCSKILVIGTIAAGQPIFAEQNIEGYDCVTECINKDNKVFGLKVKGDSMINARIYDGDVVYIRQQEDIENGEIAAILIDDEATLKRVYKIGNTVILKPENPSYKEMHFTKKDFKQLKILGKFIGGRYWIE